MSKTVEERIDYLKKCAKLYETSGTSPISDDEYDKEYAECKKAMPNHPFFSEVGGIDDEHIYGTKVKHQYIMGSLNKDPNPEEFGKWFEKTYGNEIDKVVSVLQLKVDGSSFCLKYQDGKLIQAVSRGNGYVGTDYTSNARYISGVKSDISAKGYVEIKGEVYKNKQDFEKYCSREFVNDRNYTAGAINQKNPLVTKERKLNFVAYEVRGVNFKTEIEKVKFLIDNGFETLKDYTAKIDCKGRTIADVIRAVTNFMNKFDRDTLPFSVDGIVFKLNDIEWAESLGSTDEGKRPKANRAVKFETEKAETILEGIEWNIGRTGALTPVGLLKPVQLAGTTVKRVTLHNLKELSERLGITRFGARIILQKSGDIIPKVIKTVKDGDGQKINIPNECPSCGTILVWDNTNTTKFCENLSCSSQVNRSIEHWFKTLDVLGIGEGIIAKLTNEEKDNNGNPLVQKISDMYKLDNYRSQLSNSFGDKAFSNILEAIDSVKEIPLSKFIEALGIANIGRMSKDLVSIAPTIDDLNKLSPEDIVKVDGFGEIKARNFVEGWKSQKDEINKILKYITIKENKLSSHKLGGKSFCITGTLSKPRNDIQKVIEDNGGKIASVSAKLDFLICGEDSGSKKDKAEKLGIKIISEKVFMDMIK